VERALITTAAELEDLCRELQSADAIAFDTEFVSEHTYRPELCLAQIASDSVIVAVDTRAIPNLLPLWEVLSNGNHQTVAHAAREEIGFCLDAVNRPLANLFDVQVASAMIGTDYPAGYATLTQQFLDVQLQKGETRTDWRRRPLSRQQLTYALDDVRHLLTLRDVLSARLEKLNRWSWLIEEMATQQELWREMRQGERYRNVAGAGSLHGSSAAILRELWIWREELARKRDVPAKRVLRDDLMVELAKRQTADRKQILRVRGMDKPGIRVMLDDLVACVERGLDQSADDYPRRPRVRHPPQLMMLGQFLSAALTSLCNDNSVAASLVGTASEVRDFISWLLAGSEQDSLPKPRLTEGWRHELVGDLLADLLQGRVTIRIQNPRSEQPLAFQTE
jgi:ribonuclease D